MRTITNDINENRTGRTTASDITIQESRGMEREGGRAVNGEKVEGGREGKERE